MGDDDTSIELRPVEVSLMKVNLIALSPKGRRKTFPLDSEVTTLGRQEDCHLRIALKEISRQHCQLLLHADTVRVKDLGSANGTFVNGQKVSEHDLGAGDVVNLASALSFVIQVDGQPTEVDEAKLRPAAAAPKEEKPVAAEPAAPLSGTESGVTDKNEADLILSESFFLDDEDEED